ncbi:hypothetical protein PMIN06_004564 [Paraphaeosphaeria minitans]
MLPDERLADFAQCSTNLPNEGRLERSRPLAGDMRPLRVCNPNCPSPRVPYSDVASQTPAQPSPAQPSNAHPPPTAFSSSPQTVALRGPTRPQRRTPYSIPRAPPLTPRP